jgi:hypothetical protein
LGGFENEESFSLATRVFTMGRQEDRYLNCFYGRYPGRVAIGVAYSQDMVEIFPMVIDDDHGNVLGIVAMAALTDGNISAVHIFHLSVFQPNYGNGTKMLNILCRKADQFKVILSLSPIPSPNGEDHLISSRQLIAWYHKFGFRGERLLSRQPQKGN